MSAEISAQDDRADCGQWIDCPHCAGKVLVHFKARVSILKVDIPGRTVAPVEPKKTWRDGLSGKQMNILDHAVRTGLFDSFVAALERGPHHGVPKNKEKYFLDWLCASRRKIIPQWA